MASNIPTYTPALETWKCVDCGVSAPGVTVRNAAAMPKLSWKQVEQATGKTKQGLGGIPGKGIMRKCVSCGEPLCSACIKAKIESNWWSGVEKSSCPLCGGKYGNGQELVYFAALGDIQTGLDAEGKPKSQVIDISPEKILKNEMSKDLNSWGIGLIAMGALSFILSDFLNSAWGTASIAIGIIAMFVRHRAMFIVLGGYLGVLGIWNVIIGQGSPWTFFGFLQVSLAVKEIRKFRKYP